MTLTIGTPVTFTHHLRRGERRDNGDRLYSARKVWIPVPVNGQLGDVYAPPLAYSPDLRRAESVGGFIVGERTLSNGRVIFHGYDEASTYEMLETFKVYLIVWHLRRSFARVLPRHITELGVDR